MPATYDPIATTTLGTAANSITLSSIPSTYTDLVVVFVGANAAFDDFILTFNSDTSTNYSTTQLIGDGTTPISIRSTNSPRIQLGAGSTNRINSAIINVMNYANTSIYKTSLIDYINTNDFMRRTVGLWRSTSAINSITIQRSGSGNMNVGTTMTLYGILKA
jgi:hypothetical protein